MSTTKRPLTYQFIAHYDDDTFYKQPADDRSVYHKGNEEWWPSAFSDVDQAKLVMFCLDNEERHFCVDLITGMFRAGGEEFTLNEQDQIVADKKLIYFREVRRDNVGGEWQEPEVTKYYFGYEGKDQKGKKVKRLMGINP